MSTEQGSVIGNELRSVAGHTNEYRAGEGQTNEDRAGEGHTKKYISIKF